MSPKAEDLPAHPATIMVKVGSGDWTPSCEAALAETRTASANAGKKPLPEKPKGAKPGSAALRDFEAAVSAHTFANRDDILPVLARAMTPIEVKMAPRCLLDHVADEET